MSAPPQCQQCKDPQSYIFQDIRSGDYVCSCCGHCSGAVVDAGCEWHASADKTGADPNRVGFEVDFTLSTASMDTIMSGPSGGLGTDNNGNGRAKGLFKRRAPCVAESQDQRQRQINLLISKICSMMNLNKRVMIESKRASLKCKNVKRHGPVAAASVKLACRDIGIARNMDQLCFAAKLPNSKMAWKVFNQIASPPTHTNASGGDAKVGAYQETPKWETFIATSNREAAMYGRMAANALQLEYKLGTLVENIIKAAKTKGILDGTRPSTIAAAAAYLVATIKQKDVKLPKKEAATRLSLSETSLRRAVKSLEPLAHAVLVEPKSEPMSTCTQQANVAVPMFIDPKQEPLDR